MTKQQKRKLRKTFKDYGSFDGPQENADNEQTRINEARVFAAAYGLALTQISGEYETWHSWDVMEALGFNAEAIEEMI
jgi:hypothetical protein